MQSFQKVFEIDSKVRYCQIVTAVDDACVGQQACYRMSDPHAYADFRTESCRSKVLR